MITDYAIKLSEKIKNTKSISHSQELSKLLHEEMMANCTPTKQEFVKLTSQAILFPQMIWDWVLMIPKWNAEPPQNDDEEVGDG